MDRRIKASRDQEKRLAREMGGRVTPGSGNGWITKNDVKTEKWSLECKTTTKLSYSLKDSELRLAERQALLEDREMAFVIDMQGRTWVVLSFETFASLAEET